jgi:hypothetical protein
MQELIYIEDQRKSEIKLHFESERETT